ncbi:osteopontin [Amia ocellicauda]|uniref:osteopontin n=1 Tax=Amia ocellicauda TaxID=2972642 RepID=UPI003463DBF4
MKTSVVLLLLLGTAYCLPMRRSSGKLKVDSSEEEQGFNRNRGQKQLKEQPALQAVPPQGLAVESDESSDSSKEPEAASNESTDSTDSIDSSITEEDNDTEEADDSNESDSTEATTAEIVTPEPPTELTIPPIIDTGRGDSLGYYEDSYKSMKFLKSNKIEPTLHKIYVSKVEESLNLVSKNLAGKKQVKSPSNSKDENAIDKDLKVFKAVQTSDDLDEDTSTPEVESQGLDSANAEAPQVRQAVIPQSSDQSTDSTASQGDESAEGTDSTSDETDSSQQSSEESTASPADDSNSNQTSESSESASVEATTNADNNPVLVK